MAAAAKDHDFVKVQTRHLRWPVDWPWSLAVGQHKQAHAPDQHTGEMSVLVMNGHWIFKKPSNQKEFDEIQKKQEELMGFPKKKKDSGISSLASDLAKITKSKKVSNTKVAKVAAAKRPRNAFILYSCLLYTSPSPRDS